MDPSAQYQQNIASQVYDPSQIQAYNQSIQAYYAYHHQYQQYHQQQQYPYYTQSQQEPNSIHPPGVPIPPESTQGVSSKQGFGQTHVQDQQNSYYPEGVLDQQPQQLKSSDPATAAMASNLEQGAMAGVQGQQWQGNHGGFGLVPLYGGPRPPIGQSPYGSSGKRGSRPRGGLPFRGRGSGRGRGRGRGGHFPPNPTATAAEGPASLSQGEASQIQGFGHVTPTWPPPRMAWCELCRVDCNTLEILEQHKNGKRHKKNLQVYEELQKLNSVLVSGQNQQMPNSELKPEASNLPEKVEVSEEKKLPQENVSSQALTNENEVEIEQQNVSEIAEPTAEPARKLRMDYSEAGGRGFKRKMRGGRGGKWMRTFEGSRRPVEPPKPKEINTILCELCNVKCESQVVFESHMKGKKHLSNLKRFQGHQAMLGQAALQALYPALQALYPALYPALQALCQPNTDASTSFAPQFHQGVHGPQGLLPQPGPSSIQGQASASASASAPPSVLDAHDQAVTVKTEAEQGASVDNQSENKTSEPTE